MRERNQLTITIVGIVGVPAKYGGFESLVETLLDNNEYSFKYKIFCSSKFYQKKPSYYKGASLIYLRLNPNGASSIIYDGLAILSCLKNHTDIILLLGVSGAIFLPLMKLFSNSKIICNIDGIEWKRQKWSYLARVFLKFSESIAIKYSDIIITDNKGISDYVSLNYRKDSVTIAYGADVNTDHSNYLLNKYGLSKNQYFFKVCRIEPENNIELILNAFSQMHDQKIVIIGNWHNSVFGMKMLRTYEAYSNITLLNPIYNQFDLNELRVNCKGYIHGHSAGGTNPSLVEAMGLRLPIIAFDVNFNRHTLNNNGVYFKNQHELIYEISRFNSRNLDIEKEEIYEIFLNRYTKEKIAEEYAQLFLKTC
jgi:glycosyltransferase involved in cell wall biosynthesis